MKAALLCMVFVSLLLTVDAAASNNTSGPAAGNSQGTTANPNGATTVQMSTSVLMITCVISGLHLSRQLDVVRVP